MFNVDTLGAEHLPDNLIDIVEYTTEGLRQLFCTNCAEDRKDECFSSRGKGSCINNPRMMPEHSVYHRLSLDGLFSMFGSKEDADSFYEPGKGMKWSGQLETVYTRFAALKGYCVYYNNKEDVCL